MYNDRFDEIKYSKMFRTLVCKKIEQISDKIYKNEMFKKTIFHKKILTCFGYFGFEYFDEKKFVADHDLKKMYIYRLNYNGASIENVNYRYNKKIKALKNQNLI